MRDGCGTGQLTRSLAVRAAERQHESALTLPPDMIIGVESTRATTLHYDHARRARFLDGLRALIGDAEEIGVVQRTSVTMAPVLA